MRAKNNDKNKYLDFIIILSNNIDTDNELFWKILRTIIEALSKSKIRILKIPTIGFLKLFKILKIRICFEFRN
ncbi:MAG: hypothetical protein C0417_04245 [Chlorobiaceae bacterium]|nr:hypothetical protein [Chlorobiaceae bacterium]